MQRISFLNLWPVYLLTLVYVAAWYNVDFVLVPTLLGLGFSKKTTLLITGIWGFLDMLGGYKGWSGFRSLAGKVRVLGQQEARSLIETIQIYFFRKYLKFLNDDNGSSGDRVVVKSGIKFCVFFDRISDRTIRIVLGVLKTGSYLLAFGIGVVPVPGPRMISDIFCGTKRWRKGFIVIALGNFVKTFIFIFYGWSWLFS